MPTLRKIVLPLAVWIVVAAVGLPRPGDELEFAAFHLLFEYPELRPLMQFEHLIDRIVRLACFGRSTVVEILELLASVFALLARWIVVDEPAQFVDDACALLRGLTARVLPCVESRQAFREL